MEKLKALVHYICHEFRDSPEDLGAVRLNDICWFSDVDWYYLSNDTISGYNKYTKQSQGPVLPDIKAVLLELHKEKKLSLTLANFDDDKKWFHQSLVSSKPDAFTDKQREIIDFWIEYAKSNSTSVVSDLSHDYLWWEDLDDQETIPIFFGGLINTIIPGSTMSEKMYGSEIENRR